jgi:hypothetical protein
MLRDIVLYHDLMYVNDVGFLRTSMSRLRHLICARWLAILDLKIYLNDTLFKK